MPQHQGVALRRYSLPVVLLLFHPCASVPLNHSTSAPLHLCNSAPLYLCTSAPPTSTELEALKSQLQARLQERGVLRVHLKRLEARTTADVHGESILEQLFHHSDTTYVQALLTVSVAPLACDVHAVGLLLLLLLLLLLDPLQPATDRLAALRMQVSAGKKKQQSKAVNASHSGRSKLDKESESAEWDEVLEFEGHRGGTRHPLLAEIMGVQ